MPIPSLLTSHCPGPAITPLDMHDLRAMRYRAVLPGTAPPSQRAPHPYPTHNPATPLACSFLPCPAAAPPCRPPRRSRGRRTRPAAARSCSPRSAACWGGGGGRGEVGPGGTWGHGQPGGGSTMGAAPPCNQWSWERYGHKGVHRTLELSAGVLVPLMPWTGAGGQGVSRKDGHSSLSMTAAV